MVKLSHERHYQAVCTIYITYLKTMCFLLPTIISTYVVGCSGGGDLEVGRGATRLRSPGLWCRHTSHHLLGCSLHVALFLQGRETFHSRRHYIIVLPPPCLSSCLLPPCGSFPAPLEVPSPAPTCWEGSIAGMSRAMRWKFVTATILDGSERQLTVGVSPPLFPTPKSYILGRYFLGRHPRYLCRRVTLLPDWD